MHCTAPQTELPNRRLAEEPGRANCTSGAEQRGVPLRARRVATLASGYPEE